MVSSLKSKKFRNLRISSVLFALVFLGACSVISGGEPGSEQDLKKAIAREELDRKEYTTPHGRDFSSSSYNFMLGELAFKNSELDEALAYFEAASSEEAGPAPALRRRLIQIYLRKGELDKSLNELSKVGDLVDDNIELLKLKAGILATQKKNNEAIAVYERIVELNDGFSEEPYVFLASLHAQNNDLPSAKKVLKTVLEKNPDSFFANYYSAKIFVAANDFDGAEEYYKKTIALNPSAESVQLELARVYAFQKRSEEAISLLENIIEKNPSNTKARNLLGELLLGRDRVDDALREFEAVESLEENSSETRFRIALIKLQQRDLNGAETELNLIIADDPKNSAARYYLASAYAGMKRSDDAIEQLDIIESDQKFYRESRMLAVYLLRQDEKPERALNYVNDLLETTSEDVPLLNLKAALLKETGEDSAAIRTLEKVIFLQPQNDKNYFNVAVYYDEDGRKSDAIEALEKAIEINPSNANALNYLGYTFAEENTNLDRAEKLILRAIEIDSENAYYLDSLGWVYYMRGDYQLALDKFQESVNIVNSDAVIMEHYGITLLKLGRQSEGIIALKRALTLSENSDDKKVQDRINKALLEAQVSR